MSPVHATSQVSCMQEHDTKSLVHATHNEWHVYKGTPLSFQYVPPTRSDTYAKAHHHVSSTCHFISATYARANHWVSSICHPQRVTHMQEHTPMPLVCTTPRVTLMQEHDTMTLVHTTTRTTCMQEHDTRVSQPTLRREGDAWLAGCVFHERNTRGVATNVYLRKKSEKPEKTRSTNF